MLEREESVVESLLGLGIDFPYALPDIAATNEIIQHSRKSPLRVLTANFALTGAHDIAIACMNRNLGGDYTLIEDILSVLDNGYRPIIKSVIEAHNFVIKPKEFRRLDHDVGRNHLRELRDFSATFLQDPTGKTILRKFYENRVGAPGTINPFVENGMLEGMRRYTSLYDHFVASGATPDAIIVPTEFS